MRAGVSQPGKVCAPRRHAVAAGQQGDNRLVYVRDLGSVVIGPSPQEHRVWNEVPNAGREMSGPAANGGVLFFDLTKCPRATKQGFARGMGVATLASPAGSALPALLRLPTGKGE
jgi:hypothetical protein